MDVRFVCAANMFFLVELLPHRCDVLTGRRKLVVKELTLPTAEAGGFSLHSPLPFNRGLTRCPRAYRFGRVPPYQQYGLRQQAQSFIQDVLCCIYIPVVDSAAYWASPLSHRQIFRSWPLCAADGAKLAGWKEAVSRYHLPSIPCRLILQLPPKLAPGSIRDCFC